MITRNIFFILFFFIVLPFSVVSFAINEDFNCSTVLLNETFNFPDTYVVRYENESHITSIESCLSASAPLNNSYFGDDGYMGINLTNIPVACTTQHMRAVWDFTPQNSTISDLLIFQYEFWGITNSDHSLQLERTKFLDSQDSYINSAHGISFYPYQLSQPEESFINGLDWGVSNVYWDASYPFATNYTWVIDLFTGYFDLYVGDVLTLDDYDLGAVDRDIDRFELWLQYFEGEDLQAGIDNILICGGSNADPVNNNTNCEFPILFCDDFNYDFQVRGEGWNTFAEDYSINYITPDSWELKWYDKTLYDLTHTISAFPTSYMPDDDGYSYELSITAPKFTMEFDLKITDNTSSNFSIQPKDYFLETCYNLEFLTDQNTAGINISVGDISTGVQKIYGDISENVSHTIKLVHRFTHLNHSYPFNTSVSQNLLDIYSDGTAVSLGIPFNADCININDPHFIMNAPSTVVLDNYYFYVGTDRQTSTLYDDIVPIEDFQSNVTVITSGQYNQSDLKQEIDGLWDDFGMSTTGSKVVFGIMMLIIICVFAIGFMVSARIFSFPALLAIAGLVVILEVFLGLLPIWLFGLMALMGGGIAILAIKMMVQ